MVHYSSCTIHYEGGAKNPLKDISLKFFINARYAQFCVFLESKILGYDITAYIKSPIIVEARNFVSSITYIACQDTIYSVVCLE
jgi:hypothetical protein